HVAGIAHVSADPAKEDLYYKVNRDLAIETAEKAKAEGVKQFIFMSSMIVYGKDEPAGSQKVITSDTQPSPSDFYGRSKLEADLAIQEMADVNFAVSIMRPPVIYGPGCKGNFPRLIDLAKKTFIFPDINNFRSMLYIDNLCEFLRITIENSRTGILFPQNKEYVSTKDVIVEYRKQAGKSIFLVPFPVFFVSLMSGIDVFNKAFGTKVYDKNMSQFDLDYDVVDFETGIKRMSN
ncbi:MAG: NAD-dependent epimerase/dehydratase family protein, partial [Synergistaceae bacterium]|nr:NAD-dependent epimerase/dehydratase family protein [Synergistaceae bacterium]